MSTIAGPDELTKDSIEADLLLWIDDHREAQRNLEELDNRGDDFLSRQTPTA